MSMPMNEIRHQAFDFCMQEEGGATYTNDPRDPGGPTKYGVALNYNREAIPDANGDGKIDAADVQALSEDDALAIYVDSYWVPNRCDDLPPALAFMYADMVFNPGPGAAPKLLQQALNGLGYGLAVDGKVGPATIMAAGKADLDLLLPELAALRGQYYGTRSGFAHYGKGWMRRTQRCLAQALKIHWGV